MQNVIKGCWIRILWSQLKEHDYCACKEKGRVVQVLRCFSHVNDVTKLDVHPISRFDDALDRLAGTLVQNYSPFLT